jgi:hypothetical protein
MGNDAFSSFDHFLPKRRTEPLSLVASFLKTVETSASKIPAVPSTSAASIERPVVEKIADANRRVRKLVADGKLNRAYQAEWAQRLINLLRPVYGKRNPLLITMEQWRKEIIGGGITTEAFIAKLERSEHFLRPLNGPGEAGSLVVASQASLAPTTDKIFLIHGHDEMNQLRLSRLINDEFHLEPVVLLDKPGKSAPTIDKFEDHAQSCSYAIALFTADDKVVTKRGEEYWQPRPNVIFETGWFVGRLGKERVLILLQDGVRIYSDFDGVNRVQFQENVDDKFRAIRGELNAAGLVNRT